MASVPPEHNDEEGELAADAELLEADQMPMPSVSEGATSKSMID